MKNSFLLPLVLLFVLCVCDVQTQAQEIKPQTDPNTWGFYAEKHFTELYGLCQLIDVPDKFRKVFQKKTIIPASITDTIGIPPNQRIVIKKGVDIASIFNFVYDGSANSTNKSRLESVQAANPASTLIGSNFQVLNFGIDGSTRNYVYRQTCTGAAVAAISSKLEIPLSSLKAQMNAESKANSELILVRANRFESPVYRILKAGQRPEKLAFLFELWRSWLDPNHTLNSLSDPKYVTGFQGMMISHGSQSTVSYGGKGSAEAGYMLPVFSISGSGQVEYNRTTSVTMTSPDMLFEVQGTDNNEQPIVFFEPVPKPTDIAKIAGELSPSIEGRTELLASSFYSETAYIKGIPESVCQEEGWSAEEFDPQAGRTPGNEKLNLSLRSHTFSADKGCSFTISTASPLGTALPLFARNTLNTTYPLLYSIIYNKGYTKENVTSLIKFTVRANLNRQLDFIVTPVGAPLGDVLGDIKESKGVQWSQSFRVIDIKNQVANNTAPKISSVNTNCSYLKSSGTVESPGTFDNGIFKIAARFTAQGTKKITGVTGEPCSIFFDIEIAKKDNQLTPVQTVGFPVQSPVLAPVPEVTVQGSVPLSNQSPQNTNPVPRPPEW